MSMSKPSLPAPIPPKPVTPRWRYTDPISRRSFLQLSWLTAGGAGLLGVGSLQNAYRFGISRYRAGLLGLQNPVRVVQLSDLHYGPFLQLGSLEAWIKAAQDLRPDVLVLTGDLFDRGALKQPIEPVLGLLSGLRAPLGTWMVWGNHDHEMMYTRNIAPKEMQNRLEEVGIQVLTNRGVYIRPDLYLAGIDDLLQGKPNIAAALAARKGKPATILLSHNPDMLPEVPMSVQLTLSGHTHGGQVRLPFIGAPLPGSIYGQKFSQGWVEAPAIGYISRGLGASMLPIRINCPAEMVVFDFVPMP